MAEVITHNWAGREIEPRLYLTRRNCWTAVARLARQVVTATTPEVKAGASADD